MAIYPCLSRFATRQAYDRERADPPMRFPHRRAPAPAVFCACGVEPSGDNWRASRAKRVQKCPIGTLGEARQHAGSARRLRIRGFAGVRPGRVVRSRQCPVAAASDADVRPDQRDFGDRRRIRQGPGPRRARREAGPVVFRLPFQERSGHAGLPRPRCAVADGRLLSGLGRRRRPRPGAWARRIEARRVRCCRTSARLCTTSISSA